MKRHCLVSLSYRLLRRVKLLLVRAQVERLARKAPSWAAWMRDLLKELR